MGNLESETPGVLGPGGGLGPPGLGTGNFCCFDGGSPLGVILPAP